MKGQSRSAARLGWRAELEGFSGYEGEVGSMQGRYDSKLGFFFFQHKQQTAFVLFIIIIIFHRATFSSWEFWDLEVLRMMAED